MQKNRTKNLNSLFNSVHNEKKQGNGGIKLDFEQAFDIVPHQRFLMKFSSHGIRG